MKFDDEKVRVIILSQPQILDFTTTRTELKKVGFETGKAYFIWKKYFWENEKKTYVYFEGHSEPLAMPDGGGDLEKHEKDRALSALLFGAFSAEEEQKKRLERMQAQDRLPLWLFFIVLMISLALNFLFTLKMTGVI